MGVKPSLQVVKMSTDLVEIRETWPQECAKFAKGESSYERSLAAVLLAAGREEIGRRGRRGQMASAGLFEPGPAKEGPVKVAAPFRGH
jgi:hypothetical protein